MITQLTDFLFTGETSPLLSFLLDESGMVGLVDALVEGCEAAWDAAGRVSEHEVSLLILVLVPPVSGMGTSMISHTCFLTNMPSCRYLTTVATGVGGGGDRITLGLDEKIVRYSPFWEDLG